MDQFLEIFPRIATRINLRYFIMAGTTFVLFYVVLKNLLAHRKIQVRFPAISDYQRDIFYSLLSMTIFASVAAFIFSVGKPYTQLYANIFDYGWSYYLLSLVVMLFMHDTYFYWTHRWMYHPLLYRYVHLVHHKSTNPSPWTAYAFHPLEALIEIGIVALIAFLLPAHKTAIVLFFLMQIIYNVYGHLGYELFPKHWSTHPVGKWINTSVSHNQHHQFVTGNYGLYFTIWDRLMGTLREDYDTHYQKATT